jgi:hypothetical protein
VLSCGKGRRADGDGMLAELCGLDQETRVGVQH